MIEGNMTKRITVFVAWFISLTIAISYSPAIPILADSTEYPLSEVVDYDYDDDGVVDIDDVFYAINLYFNQEYDRAVDSNYDGVVAKDDVIDTIQHYYDGLDIVAIRQAVKNDHSAELHWENIDFSCNLIGLEPSQVEKYTRGWLDVWKHPYSFSEYHCSYFTIDYIIAAYKDLGYGCLLSFVGVTTLGYVHSENIFWDGDNRWQSLDNWYCVDNNGHVYRLLEGNKWDCKYNARIYFPIENLEQNGSTRWIFAPLEVDWGNKCLDYLPCEHRADFYYSEEPIWIGEWDTMIT